jgi:hypothetical protein
LFSLGILGVVSFLTMDIEAVVALLPGASMNDVPFPPLAFKFISLIQPTVLLAIAVAAGVALSDRIGLHAPAAEAAASGQPVFAALRPQILSGVIAGVACGVVLILLWIVAKPLLPAEFAARAEAFNRVTPFVCRIFYGGFTEELLLRWGMMTFFVWLPYRFVSKSNGKVPGSYFIIAIAVSALLFGVGHLGIVIALAQELTAVIVTTVVAGNTIFGLVAGFLYWRKGLESAFIAHITTHVVLIAALLISG